MKPIDTTTGWNPEKKRIFLPLMMGINISVTVENEKKPHKKV